MNLTRRPLVTLVTEGVNRAERKALALHDKYEALVKKVGEQHPDAKALKKQVDAAGAQFTAKDDRQRDLDPRDIARYMGNQARSRQGKARRKVRLGEAQDRRAKPGSVSPAPKSHGSAPPPHIKLLPGEAGNYSNKQLGFRSHQQRLARSGNRNVTFSNGIAEKTVDSIESTDLRAIKDARTKSRLSKGWKVVKINGKPYTGKQA